MYQNWSFIEDTFRGLGAMFKKLRSTKEMSTGFSKTVDLCVLRVIMQTISIVFVSL